MCQIALILLCAFIAKFTLIKTEVEESPSHIQVYEYGTHVPGESRSFRYVDKIPKLTNTYNLNITPTEKGLENRYTYMRVEYVNAVSKVIINYDPHTFMLSMSVVFPFFETPFGVIGYSMPLKSDPAQDDR